MSIESQGPKFTPEIIAQLVAGEEIDIPEKDLLPPEVWQEIGIIAAKSTTSETGSPEQRFDERATQYVSTFRDLIEDGVSPSEIIAMARAMNEKSA